MQKSTPTHKPDRLISHLIAEIADCKLLDQFSEIGVDIKTEKNLNKLLEALHKILQNLEIGHKKLYHFTFNMRIVDFKME